VKVVITRAHVDGEYTKEDEKIMFLVVPGNIMRLPVSRMKEESPIAYW
jgi:hypothetical protein